MVAFPYVRTIHTGVVAPLSRYVEQFDTLLGTLTVEEMLMYTAELKCPMSEPRADKKERVEALLMDLGLDVRSKALDSVLIP